MFNNKKFKMKLFDGNVGSFSCHIEENVNLFIARDDINVLDVKVSNSSRTCVVCVFYTEVEPETSPGESVISNTHKERDNYEY